MASRYNTKGFISKLYAAAFVAWICTGSSGASAAADYEGRIGKIDVRTGHADTTVYRNGIVIRDSSRSVVCVVAPGVENHDQFLSLATTAMLAGKTVRIGRGGALNGQFKCYQIEVTN